MVIPSFASGGSVDVDDEAIINDGLNWISEHQMVDYNLKCGVGRNLVFFGSGNDACWLLLVFVESRRKSIVIEK